MIHNYRIRVHVSPTRNLAEGITFTRHVSAESIVDILTALHADIDGMLPAQRDTHGES